MIYPQPDGSTHPAGKFFIHIHSSHTYKSPKYPPHH